MGLFGTDGIRGRAGEGPLSPGSVHRIGQAMGEVLRSASGQTEVVVARDTRESGEAQQAALAAGLEEAGARVIDLGILPTPALSWHLGQAQGLAGGVMITASHNQWHDNGLKLFGSDGAKVADALEDACEARYLELVEGSGEAELSDTPDPGHARTESQHAQVQEAYLASLTCPSDLTGRSVVVDSAAGATWHTLPAAFRSAGAQVDHISPEPNGRNINHNCGATQPESLAAAVVRQGAWGGVAVDGDGDRLILVDELGAIHDGDIILGVLADAMKQMGLFRGEAVVGTVTTNGGLAEFLKGLDLSLIRTDVGDRHVARRMLQEGCNLGGESSGHILTPDLCPTGDGTRVALWLLGHASQQDQRLSTLMSTVPRYPVANRKVDARHKPQLSGLSGLQDAVTEVEEALDNRAGSVLLRYSGTEPVLRIRVEGPDGDLVQRCADRLAACAAQALAG
ncbi:MAG TPA: phosphoglucosamine mutase [Deltaproteobacteria bacterium]|nr:phosphoglucosamine mutase [Deltaproteobacteria bacterium]HCP46571.1 phosphoglucosamine mutase [Deltaproteobacteria bacterium]